MHRLVYLLLATSACVADGGDEGFEIVHNLAPAPGACTLTPGGAFQSSGRIEASSPNGYVLTPEISSRLTTGEASAAQRTIALRGAKVEVLNAETGASLRKFTSLFAASLPPGGKTTAAFDVIPADLLASVGATETTRVQLLAKVTPYGAVGGSGDEIDGVTFQYPVTVCVGCVAIDLGACPLPAGTMIEDNANGCNPYQDGSVACCSNGTSLVCPPIVATAAR